MSKTYNSYSEAMKDLLPNNTVLMRMGKKLKEHFQEKIISNKTKGLPITNATYRKKEARGAKNPRVKLREGDGLIDSMTNYMDRTTLKVGWDGTKTHKEFRSGDNPEGKTNADIAHIHHKGGKFKNKPRIVLEFDTGATEIIESEIINNIIR